MELIINKKDVFSINFSKRKGRNKTFKNWLSSSLSKSRNIFLTHKECYLNKEGKVIVRYTGPKYIIDDINSGKILINKNKTFFPKEEDENINQLLDQELRLKTEKYDLGNLTIMDLIDCGYFDKK